MHKHMHVHTYTYTQEPNHGASETHTLLVGAAVRQVPHLDVERVYRVGAHARRTRQELDAHVGVVVVLPAPLTFHEHTRREINIRDVRSIFLQDTSFNQITAPTGLVSWSQICLLNSIAVFETVRSYQLKNIYEILYCSIVLSTHSEIIYDIDVRTVQVLRDILCIIAYMFYLRIPVTVFLAGEFLHCD